MRSKFFLFLISILSLCIYCSGQPLTIQWQKCLGGTLGEEGYGIMEAPDGGYLTCGLVASNNGDVSGNHNVGQADGWVVKLDSSGYILWQRCYGGSNGDAFYSIASSNSKGFIVAGPVSSIDGDLNGVYQPGGLGSYWIIDCDSSGAILWQKCLGGSGDEVSNKIITTKDNGFAIIGMSNSNDFDVVGRHDSSVCPECVDIWFVKLDSVGTIELSKCYGGIGPEVGYSLLQTPDSGFIIAGTALYDNGDVQGVHGGVEDYWIIKINSSGSIQWQKCLGGSHEEVPNDIILTQDGGYIVTGTATSDDYDVSGNHNLGTKDVWIVKLSSLGNIQWQKCLGGSWDDFGRKIIQVSDGGYLTLNYTESTDGDLISNPPSMVDIWIVRLDISGNILWQQCFGGSNIDGAYDMQLTSDGGVIFTGLGNSNDGDVSGNHGDYDVWVVKLAPLPDGIAAQINSITDFVAFKNYNTNTLGLNFYCNGNENVKIQLLDLAGRVLLQQALVVSAGFNQKQIQTGNMGAGIYLVRLLTDTGVVSKKLVIE